MKSYYSDDLKETECIDINVKSNNHDFEITENSDGISDDTCISQDDYNFERYKDYKPGESQVCSNSLSKPAIITLISIMSVLVISIVVIIVVKVNDTKSKASEYADSNVQHASTKGSAEEADTKDTLDDETFEDELAIEEEEPTAEPTEEPSNTLEIQEGLMELSKTHSSVTTILNNMQDYPERLLEDVIRNPELLDFTLNYPNKVNQTYSENIDITSDVYNTSYEVPLFMQWDSRWGYYPYSSGVIGISGCGPTSLAMVYVYLTGDTSMNPLKMAKYSVDNGYVTVGVGTKWSLMTTGAINQGLQAQKIEVSEANMIAHLQQGHPLIASMGPGIFTDKGHFIVFRKYENGQFYVNDPFCKAHTDTAWNYSQFSAQIKGMWAYWR